MDKTVDIKFGNGGCAFHAFLRRHEEFLRQKFSHLIGKPLLGQSTPLGVITRIELGDYSAVYTDDKRVRVMLCRAGGVTGPTDVGEMFYYLLPNQVSTPCKLIGSTRAVYTPPINDRVFPTVLWRIIQEYEGPRSWTCTTSEQCTSLDAWFGPFFSPPRLNGDCEEYFQNTWLK